MKRVGVLVAKVLGFAAVVVWVMGFLMGAFAVYPLLENAVIKFGITPGITAGFMYAWFWATIIAASIWAAVKGFGIVGRWERPERPEEPEKEA